MPQTFDHAIIGTSDLAGIEADFRDLGFTVSARPDVGATETENRLVCFPDGSYIEIFALRGPAQSSEHRWAPLVAKGDGWVDYSVHVADVAAEAKRLAGLRTTGPRSGGRALTDGRRWGVAVLLAGRGVDSPVLPFLVQDTEAHNVRVPDGAAAVQPGGVGGIAGVTLVTRQLATVEPSLAAIFGPGEVTTAPGEANARRFDFGGYWVMVIQPDAGAKEMADHLQLRGEGLFEVTLGSPGRTKPGDGQLLPVAATHGARLRLAAS